MNESKKRDTLADIVAEIRAYGAQPPPRLMWLEIADRIEAAAKREVAEQDEVVLRLTKSEYRGMREALSEHDRLCEMLCEMLPESRKSVGNAAATRESLEMARDALKSAEKYVYGDPPDGGAIGWDDVWPSEWHNALEAVERAISAPARNCDMYATYAEAAEAHKEYATAYIMRASNKFDTPMEFDEWLFAPYEGGVQK